MLVADAQLDIASVSCTPAETLPIRVHFGIRIGSIAAYTCRSCFAADRQAGSTAAQYVWLRPVSAVPVGGPQGSPHSARGAQKALMRIRAIGATLLCAPGPRLYASGPAQHLSTARGLQSTGTGQTRPSALPVPSGLGDSGAVWLRQSAPWWLRRCGSSLPPSLGKMQHAIACAESGLRCGPGCWHALQGKGSSHSPRGAQGGSLDIECLPWRAPVSAGSQTPLQQTSQA
mmetsp:Transcript_51766/g.108170  ORF Transcript_51766/g.108170 Transcript_51766/m.108170 type:complete len:230 (+) Transcript_51766:1115-1804(+)